MRSALAVVLFVVSCSDKSSYNTPSPVDASTCKVSEKAALEIESVRDLGTFSAPPTLRTFSGGASARVGESVMWTFAEAVLTDGEENRGSIFGFSSFGDAWRPWIVADAAGRPAELLPLTDEERAQNKATPDDRWVVWPVGVIEQSLEATVFYGRFKVGPVDLDIRGVDAGIAHVRKGDKQARDRVVVFKTGTPAFGIGPMVHDGRVYAWACIEGGCVLGRAPLARLAEVEAWETYDGAAFVKDLTKGSKLITNAPGDLSMSYNPWLRKFVLVHSESFTDKVVIHTADKPEGPWSAPVTAFQTGGNQYAGKEHVALGSACGDSIVITYFNRVSDGGPDYVGELHAKEVKLR